MITVTCIIEANGELQKILCLQMPLTEEEYAKLGEKRSRFPSVKDFTAEIVKWFNSLCDSFGGSKQ